MFMISKIFKDFSIHVSQLLDINYYYFNFFFLPPSLTHLIYDSKDFHFIYLMVF